MFSKEISEVGPMPNSRYKGPYHREIPIPVLPAAGSCRQKPIVAEIEGYQKRRPRLARRAQVRRG